MARSKYTSDRVEIIIKTLEETGSDEAAYKAGGISKPVFYRWQKDYKDFFDQVAAAKKHYKKYCPKELKRLAHERALTQLTEGITITWSSKEVTRDAAGQVIQTKEKVSQQKQPPNQRLIERFLGPEDFKPKPDPLLARLQSLVEEGLALPEQAQIIEEGLEFIRQRMMKLTSKQNGD